MHFPLIYTKNTYSCVNNGKKEKVICVFPKIDYKDLFISYNKNKLEVGKLKLKTQMKSMLKLRLMHKE